MMFQRNLSTWRSRKRRTKGKDQEAEEEREKQGDENEEKTGEKGREEEGKRKSQDSQDHLTGATCSKRNI